MFKNPKCSLIFLVLLSLIFATVAVAETMNHKISTWGIRNESVAVDDVEGHNVGTSYRGAFFVFDNNEVASASMVINYDFVKNTGPIMQYVTLKFEDGSTIVFQSHGVFDQTAAQMLGGEIIKGTGRFAGIKGNQTAGKARYLPKEPGEISMRGYGAGALTYTLPIK